MITGFGLLLLFHVLGIALQRLFSIPLPGNVLGMILLATALVSGLVRQTWIEEAADLLIDNLSFLFVPAGVGCMSFFHILPRQWFPLSVSIVASLVVVLVVTGKGCEAAMTIARKACAGRQT